MDKDLYGFSLKAYEEEYRRKYDELETKGGKAASGKKRKEWETEAQKSAIRHSMVKGLEKFGSESVAELWGEIYRVHLYRKSGISDMDTVSKVVSAGQSWKKSSGHAFEEMIKELANLSLTGTNIEVILQRDLNALLKAGELANEPRDIAWLEKQIHGNIFDLYCTLTADGKRYCFGCLQCKTSIRDRVTRDREPSLHAMQSFFWSVAFVLDGDFLKNPKFQHMVNGGSEEFPTNGWHGMYVLSLKESNDRIYPLGCDFSLFKIHAEKAANYWKLSRQWFNTDWRADE